MGVAHMALNLDDYRNKLVIAAGEWPLVLCSHGWAALSPPELANIEKADMVREVAAAFLNAGAEVLVTNTGRAHWLSGIEGASAEALSTEAVASINRRGAQICRAVVSARPGGPALVFGAIGPTERLLMLDEVKEADMEKAYAAQATALATGGVDAIICRSFREMSALCIAVRAARTTGLPVIGSMVFDCGADYTETSLGATIPQACEALKEAGAAALGCEGGDSPDTLPAAVAEMQKRWAGPIWVGVGAGTSQWVDERVEFSDSPEGFGGRLTWLRNAGANFVCGGRGVGLAHLAALAAARKQLN